MQILLCTLVTWHLEDCQNSTKIKLFVNSKKINFATHNLFFCQIQVLRFVGLNTLRCWTKT